MEWFHYLPLDKNDIMIFSVVLGYLVFGTIFVSIYLLLYGRQ